MSSQLSPQSIFDNLCSKVLEVRLHVVHIAGRKEPESAQRSKQGA